MNQGREYDKLDNHHPTSHPHAEEGEGPWLMSFADMVTLLMCFFILFFTTNSGKLIIENPDELMKKLEAVQRLLGTQTESEQRTMQTSVQVRTPTGSDRSVDAYRKDLAQVSQELNLVFSVGMPQPGEIEVTFLNTHFFNPGSAELTKRAEVMLAAVAKKLDEADPDSTIEVEGHTDSDPIRSRMFPSNWELSGARAATVVRLLQTYGIPPSRLRASGLAHYRPIAPEKDARGSTLPENKSLNRRIVVRIKQPLTAQKAPIDLDGAAGLDLKNGTQGGKSSTPASGAAAKKDGKP